MGKVRADSSAALIERHVLSDKCLLYPSGEAQPRSDAEEHLVLLAAVGPAAKKNTGEAPQSYGEKRTRDVKRQLRSPEVQVQC